MDTKNVREWVEQEKIVRKLENGRNWGMRQIMCIVQFSFICNAMYYLVWINQTCSIGISVVALLLFRISGTILDPFHSLQNVWPLKKV